MVKPNDDIFLHLLEECDRAAGDCFFIDDSAANIDTADRLGFQTHHFTSADRLEDDLRRRGLLD